MPKNSIAGNDVLVEKRRSISAPTEEKALAEELLESKGYKPQTKPRRVNGGSELADTRHTESNKKRLNSTLSATPVQARRRAAASTSGSVKKRRAVSDTVKTAANARIPVAKEKAATPFPMSYIFFIVILTVIIVYVVHLYIYKADMEASLAESRNMLTELKNEKIELEFEKSKKYNLEEIERIAREEYGMVNRDQLHKEYYTPENSDKVEVLESGSEESAAGVLLSGFGNTVSNLLSYIN